MQEQQRQSSGSRRARETYILVGMVLTFSVLIFVALMLLGATTEQGKTARWVTHSRDLRESLDQLVMHLSDAENGRRGFVLSGDDRYLAHYSNGVARARTDLETLRELVNSNRQQSAACNELESLFKKRLTILARSIDERQTNGFNAAAQTAFMEEGQQAMEPIRQLTSRMADEEAGRLREQRAVQEKHVEGAKGFAVLVSLIAVGLFTVLLYLLTRANRRQRKAEENLTRINLELEQRVRERTIELSAASEEIQRVNEGLERRILERTSQLEDANRELESFSYSVSHDLRAPLRHILGYAEMLQRAVDGQLSEKARRYLNTISEAGSQMGRLIDDLLNFSRIGRAEMQCQRVPLDGLVRETIRGLEMLLQDRHINWKIAKLPVVLGDPAALRQVMLNLIGNAVKYTAQRETAEIEIGSSVDDGGATVVFVRDNGAGFDMTYVDKLFGVFQRLHRADEFEGTGIGLATVRRVVSRHGGRTWAEGMVGRGATFYFTLTPAPVESS